MRPAEFNQNIQMHGAAVQFILNVDFSDLKANLNVSFELLLCVAY